MTDITLLDGSIGQELVHRSGDKATPLWSQQVMIDHPDLVGALHADYYAAGATVASTNTYGLYESRLAHAGLADRIDGLIDTALEQAEMARDRAGGGRIAGSMGPLMASYRPDLVVPPDEAAARFADRARRLAPRVDLLLIETISSLTEAEGALKGGTGHGKPLWVGFSVEDHDGTRLRSGEPVEALLPLIEAHGPDAVLVNCTRPEAVMAALPILARAGLPFGAYANGFVEVSEAFKADRATVDALENRTDLPPATYADHVMGWIAEGATIVGGCCEVGPAHIAEIARRLRGAGHRIV
jgi:S-methylmethionine-dependent homocysteine/selenocysteine methylase